MAAGCRPGRDQTIHEGGKCCHIERKMFEVDADIVHPGIGMTSAAFETEFRDAREENRLLLFQELDRAVDPGHDFTP